MTGQYRDQFPASVPALTEAQRRLVAFLGRAGLTERLVGRAELLVEELVMNLLSYGTAPGASPAVRLRVEPGPGDACHFVFEDNGAAFDPTAVTPPAPARDMASAPVGGLGLVLLHRMARELRYARLPEGWNQLRFTLSS